MTPQPGPAAERRFLPGIGAKGLHRSCPRLKALSHRWTASVRECPLVCRGKILELIPWVGVEGTVPHEPYLSETESGPAPVSNDARAAVAVAVATLVLGWPVLAPDLRLRGELPVVGGGAGTRTPTVRPPWQTSTRSCRKPPAPRASDPAWKPSEKQIAVIQVATGEGGSLNNFCLDDEGRVLACVGKVAGGGTRGEGRRHRSAGIGRCPGHHLGGGGIPRPSAGLPTAPT